MGDKKTKIICTLGPSTDNDDIMRGMLSAGMDIARFNCSHGSHTEHAGRLSQLHRICGEIGSPCAVMLDTKGPEIRTGELVGGRAVRLEEGDEIVLCVSASDGQRPRQRQRQRKQDIIDKSEMDGELEPGLTERQVDTSFGNIRSNAARQVDDSSSVLYVSQSCPDLPNALSVGDRILIDDGLLEFRVADIAGDTGDIRCTAMNSGYLGERKSINIPGIRIPLPALTDQDRSDLIFGIEQDIDFVAASFVRSAEDIREIRRFLQNNGGADIKIIAKIESAEAVENFHEILSSADGIMIARGDLGVEIPISEIPHLQKKFIRAANRASRPVITATQLLDSMIRSPRPTRAEVTDVANAVYDGTDALMLSGETANGKYPVESVEIMSSIAKESERHMLAGHITERAVDCRKIEAAVSLSAVETAENIGASCIVAPTMSGRTALLVSKLRPDVPIYAVTPFPKILRQLQICWGVRPMLGDVQGGMRHVVEQAHRAVVEAGVVRDGEIAVFTAGDPTTSPDCEETEIFGAGVERGKPATATNAMYVVQIREDRLSREDRRTGED